MAADMWERGVDEDGSCGSGGRGGRGGLRPGCYWRRWCPPDDEARWRSGTDDGDPRGMRLPVCST
ncbi:hypothetical protein E2562_026128 [Oryza meyeriana var. granulata]|uniref:Uncharacterized protein n=1 Tax=Oryza meyeriana var. granulata TaxID=110450 RepID=A0A6G1FCL9_9ORYZ|nr:hypothetical protein E2562_026128 [Oryza meyeriana var. granulata]